jgi:RHS repeat-associated protein
MGCLKISHNYLAELKIVSEKKDVRSEKTFKKERSYLEARYYNPKISNWLSVDDPLINGHYLDGNHDGGVFNSFNLSAYGYCRQNPVLFIDPDGNQFEAVRDVLKNKVMPLVESAGNKLKQTIAQAKTTATRMINQAKQNVVQAVGTKEARNKILNATRKISKDAQTSSLIGIGVGAGLSVVPVTAPVGFSTMAAGAVLNTVSSAVEAGADVLQAINNDDTQGKSAYTTTVNFVIGEGIEFMVNKIAPGAGESTKPVKDEIIKRVLPEASGQLNSEINKQELGEYKPVNE